MLNTAFLCRTIAWPTMVFALLLGAASCIEFEHQEAVYSYDRDTDTLRIFQVYRGIFGASNDTLTDQQIQQLTSVMEGGRTFFFANWLFEINLPSIREALGREPRQDTAVELAWRRVGSSLLDSTTIENGPFFRDREGRLSAWQKVEIRNFSRLLETVNAALNAAVLDDSPPESPYVDLAKARTMARDNHTWIEMQGNMFQINLPLSRAAMMKIRRERRREFEEILAADIAAEEASWKLREVFAWLDNPFWIHPAKDDDITILQVGMTEPEPVAVRLQCARGYRDNAAAWLLEQGHPIPDEPPPDLERIAADFLQPRNRQSD